MQEKWLLEAWFATLESKETNRREGKKLGGDFSKTGAADRESNVEHMQTAAVSKSGENRRGIPGLATEKRRRERKGKWRRAAGPED